MIMGPSRSRFRIGVFRFSPLAFVVRSSFAFRSTSMNWGTFRLHGGPVWHCPSAEQPLAWTAVHRNWLEAEVAAANKGHAAASTATAASAGIRSLIIASWYACDSILLRRERPRHGTKVLSP